MNLDTKERRKALTAVSVLLLVFVATYFFAQRLGFPVEKDELHFWPTAQFFAEPFPPNATQLATYNDLNTPLPFLIFGAAEHFLHGGIWLGRLINLFAALACALLVLLAPGKPTSHSIKSTLGLLLFPYFLGVSTHLYTDPIAALFSLLGVVLFLRKNYFGTFVCFAAAISSRQYAIVFPLTLLAWHFATKSFRPRAVICLVSSLAVLAGWFYFWKGPANPVALRAQVVATSGWASLLPQNAGYFLACVGLYYVLPEALLFSESRDQWRARGAKPKLVALSLIGVIAFFALFPPLGNLPPYPFREMGLLDKGLRYFFNDFFRVSFLAGLAWVAVLRFASLDLGAGFVFFYALLMVKAHVGWDKYALFPLLVLWWLKAKNTSKREPCIS